MFFGFKITPRIGIKKKKKNEKDWSSKRENLEQLSLNTEFITLKLEMMALL